MTETRMTDEVDVNSHPPLEEEKRQRYYIAKMQQLVKEKETEIGRPLTACVTTFGCQMNARDSEKLIGILKEIGFEESTDENSDFVLYNTCTVRENANLRVYGRLGHLNSLKKQHPGMIIALCGCMMQEETVVEKIRKSYRFVDLIFGTHNIFKLAELLYQRMTEDGMVGEHDFKSFCSARTQVENTVRTITALSVERDGCRIRIRVSGTGFLYNMVRIIVGTLIRVGTGYWKPEHVKEILEAKDRQKAGPKVPPEGLTLQVIRLEQDPWELQRARTLQFGSQKNDPAEYSALEREAADGEDTGADE